MKQNPFLAFFIFLALASTAQQNCDSTNFYQAVELHQKGKFNDAIAKYTEQIKTCPAFIEAYLNRGFCYYVKKNTVLAHNDFNAAIEKSSDKTQVISQIAGFFFSTERYDTAFAFFKQITVVDPYNSDAYFKMGRCKWLARVKIMIANKVDDYATDTALKSHLAKEIFQYYDKAVYLDSIENWRFYTKRGMNSMAAMQDMHTNYEYYYFRGLLKANLHNYIGGLADYEASLLIHPTIQAYRFAASLAKEVAQNEKACEYIQLWATLFNPSENESLTNKHQIADQFCKELGIAKKESSSAPYQLYKLAGDVNYNQGKYDSALIEYKKAIAMNSPDLKLYTQIADIYENDIHNTNHLDSAEAVLTRLITNNTENKSLIFNRAEFYRRNGQTDKAITDYLQGLHADTTDYESICNLAFCYDGKNDWDNAIKYYTMSINVQPNSIAYANRGRLYKKTNKIELAIADEENTIKLDPSYAQAYLILGNIYLQQNNPVKAVDLYKQGLAQKPEGQIKTLLETQLLKAQ